MEKFCSLPKIKKKNFVGRENSEKFLENPRALNKF